MENYFWVAAQNHSFEIERPPRGHACTSSRGMIIDVLALAGPNRKEIQVLEKRVTCLVKAVMARAFEIALLVERQTSMTPLKGYWLDTAKSLIGFVPRPTCRIRACPIQEIPDVPKSDFGLLHRIQVDVSECYPEDIQLLKWALADLEGPLTALGRAWGSEKYVLVGAPDCVSGETQSMSKDLWTRILSLLSRLGVKDLTTRLARAAVFVWDLVDCTVHKGLGKTTVIDLAEKYCKCPTCVETWRGGTLKALQASVLKTVSDCPPDESTPARSSGEVNSSPTKRPKVALYWFKLRADAVDAKVTLPTLEWMKLRTVKTLAQLQDFRLILFDHLSRAGYSITAMHQLPQDILQREMESILLYRSEKSAKIANALLEGNASRTCRDLVLRLNTICVQSFTTTSRGFFESLGGGRTDWTRWAYKESESRIGSIPDFHDYHLKPCRVFAVPAIDNPLLHSRGSETSSGPSPWHSMKYDSTVELSTRGEYGSGIWSSVSGPDITGSS